MNLLSLLQTEAVQRGLLAPDAELDPATLFALVRDMPYMRASSRQPEVIIREWRGTCSGKHYLLKALFAELGLPAKLMAGAARTKPDPATTLPEILATLEPADGYFVDVHNWLVVETPKGAMIVDATWPLVTRAAGMVVNETFILGQDQQLAYIPEQTWVVPEHEDPQAFKQKLLQEQFSPAELAARDAFIQKLSAVLAQHFGA